MKTLILSGTLLLAVALGKAQTITNDNFESYALGSWPGSWVPDANAADTAHNRIEGNPAGGSSKTLRLYGTVGGCWAGMAYLSSPNCDFFEVEFDVYNGNEPLSGCHPDRAVIGLKQGTSWINPGFGILRCAGDGNMYDYQGHALQSYQTLRWYHVKVSYARTGTSVQETYWIDGVLRGTATSTVTVSQQTALDHFAFTAQEGSAWFDNLVIQAAPSRTADDFESYGLDTWPGPWAPDANAVSDRAHNGVQADPVGSGSKTLRLFGQLGGCWAALAYLPFSYTDSFEVECDVYNGNETLNGCHPIRGTFGLKQGTSWVNPVGRGLVTFGYDGAIYDSQGHALQSYQTLRWYHVKVVYTRNGSTLLAGLYKLVTGKRKDSSVKWAWNATSVCMS